MVAVGSLGVVAGASVEGPPGSCHSYLQSTPLSMPGKLQLALYNIYIYIYLFFRQNGGTQVL